VYITISYRVESTSIYSLLLYVDDMLIASKSRSAIDKLKKDLSFEFEMKDLGEAKKVLGMELGETEKVARLA